MAYPHGVPGSYSDYGSTPQNIGGFAPPQYQNMPFNAPVMRMGGDPNAGDGRSGRYDNRGRAGLGADHGGPRNLDRDRQQIRDSMQATQPPTREEVARTIFIGGLGDSAPPDEAIESILRCAGKLRRWTRARDADDKKCRFGFAEYEDVDSLETAKDLFGEGLEAPLYKDGNIVLEDTPIGEQSKAQMTKLLVVIDEQSAKYIVEWMSKRDDPETARAFRLDTARVDMQQCLASLRNATNPDFVAFEDGPFPMADAPNGGQEAGNVPASLDEELADIPAEQRATVAQEIKNFRDRANRRDLDRPRQEGENEELSHVRTHNRLASPGPGPDNSRPGVAGAPSGPKGYRGAQLPSDHANGDSFVSANLSLEDESEASDAELEKRRIAAKAEEQEKQYLDAERRWLNRERARTAAQERERTRDEAEARDRERQKEAMARRYSNWNDEEEERIGREEYYYDRPAWARKRAAQRDREAREDDRDRQQEQRDKDAERRRDDDSRGAADRFMAETDAEMAATKQGGGAFQISLGGVRLKPVPQATRPANDVAGLLEEEEDAVAAGQRELRAIPLADTADARPDMTQAERDAARQALAGEIPTASEDLFAWEIRWSYISPELLDREIRPFVEKKVVDLLGIQDYFLVDLVMTALNERQSAAGLILELEKVLDEDAETLVKKVWRLLVFFGEAEARGLM